jgi:hypothetical protein
MAASAGSDNAASAAVQRRGDKHHQQIGKERKDQTAQRNGNQSAPDQQSFRGRRIDQCTARNLTDNACQRARGQQQADQAL